MTFIPLFFVALGVSADAFAVGIGKGLHMRALAYRNAAIIALTFGLFQAVMPLIGWLLGTGLADYIRDYDHWVAFGLLLLIGGKMLWEAIFAQDEEKDSDGTIKLRELLLLAVATSIDALAVGITFAFLHVSILGAVALIGVVTFVLTFVGVVLGHRVGARFRGPAEIAGGLILIGIGARILLDHLGIW
jgi:putative Mn2+ efflux pump MntP